ncbi:hypothetical protein SAMN05444722_0634 [Rhodovulum sp. ES.010]|uniref:hypothetical protein n=1 Tax=Rhodovulum sp. ES.010 TaxID=1882821 RepID=UPI00092767AD|nr:hypothetical protein [Rhodovulum sp. ES.010]SIO15473.1 hypothetical protein SAMN05444722_0634 [Rhodovulum sp. ES.010]
MSRLIPLVLVAGLAGCVAQSGSSQLEVQVTRSLELAGVSESCIAALSQRDFAALKGIAHASETGEGMKNKRLRFLAERKCGQTRSIVVDAFGAQIGG